MGMGMEGAVARWCGTCGTAHDGPRACPGSLPATGAERPAWRVQVETPRGHEAIGVLVAPSHDVWRARIVTFPNVLWTIPGGHGTIKFVGDTQEEAAAQAIAFIESHVQAKRLVRRDGLAPVGPEPMHTPLPTSPTAFSTARRKLTCLPVRWGHERARVRGVTVNVSLEGMFIGAIGPEDDGQSLLINLDLDGHTIPLRGLVMWSRERSEPGRPMGMGVRLSEPPVVYQSYVTALP
ncbi:MAG TPA: PilZ domain-containing protein [Candidatus Polarisedimenticolaceae bacterium]|nr:PilZ domain-containing protein [Candidatus Polarisedimenticolaceae bacterium]